MVNLRGIANRYTRGINPNIPVVWWAYGGFTVTPSGKPVVTWTDGVPLPDAQVQSLTVKEIQHLDDMNIAGCERAIYTNVQLSAVDRATQNGGDILVFEGLPWQVTAILEGWTTAGWCKAALTKQMPVAGQWGFPNA